MEIAFGRMLYKTGSMKMRCQKSCESLDKYYLMRLDIMSEYLFDSLSVSIYLSICDTFTHHNFRTSQFSCVFCVYYYFLSCSPCHNCCVCVSYLLLLSIGKILMFFLLNFAAFLYFSVVAICLFISSLYLQQTNERFIYIWHNLIWVFSVLSPNQHTI